MLALSHTHTHLSCLDPWQYFDIGDNQVGDDGAKALASAVANGALPALKVLWMRRDAPALKAVCEARGIAYH